MTTLCRLRAEVLNIPFKVAFRHASADRHETSSVLVEAVSERGVTGHGESCPRPYVTGETVDSVLSFIATHEASLCGRVRDVISLRAWMSDHAEVLDREPAAWCAAELAILDMLGRESRQTVESLLTLPPVHGSFRYTAVLGDAQLRPFSAMAERYRREGFTDFKVKLSGDLPRDRQKLDVLRTWPDVRVRVDANNLWNDADEALGFLRALDAPLFAVEEPIRPNQYADLARIGEGLGCRIVLDESVLRVSQLQLLGADPKRWLVNVRLSKMGGLIRSLEMLRAARASRIDIIVGAQVGESSLLTRAALIVARMAGDALVAQEGAFGTHLLERDVCAPVIMFGAGGVLDAADVPALYAPGFGLQV